MTSCERLDIPAVPRSHSLGYQLPLVSCCALTVWSRDDPGPLLQWKGGFVFDKSHTPVCQRGESSSPAERSGMGPHGASEPWGRIPRSVGLTRGAAAPVLTSPTHRIRLDIYRSINPYSEARFKTFKYRPEFPDRFGSIEDARAFCQRFFRWYNQEHRYSGLGLHTPADVHFGRAAAMRVERARVLEVADAAHPERFVRQVPVPPALPGPAWINKPPEVRQRSNRPHRPVSPGLTASASAGRWDWAIIVQSAISRSCSPICASSKPNNARSIRSVSERVWTWCSARAELG
jgi:hypothetical protein